MGLFDNPDKMERVPVPLILDDFNEEKLTYAIEMRLPLQVTLLEEFEAMVHDECLWNAHRRGLVPVGQVLITTRAEEKKPKKKPAQQLEEGKPLIPDIISSVEQEMRDRVRTNHKITGNMLGLGVESPVQETCIARAEVLIGTAL